MAKTAKSKIDFRSIDIPTAAQKPLYAGVGAGDLAVTAVREYVADVQKRLTGLQKDAQGRVSDVQKSVTGFDPKKARKQAADSAAKQAKARREAVEKRVAELQELPTKVQTRVQTVVDDNVAAVSSTYSELAKRGEKLVKGAKLPTSASVEVKVNTANPAARKPGTTRKPASPTAQPVTRKSPATGSAKKSPAKSSPAKSSPAKKTTTAAKKTTTTAKKTTTGTAKTSPSA